MCHSPIHHTTVGVWICVCSKDAQKQLAWMSLNLFHIFLLTKMNNAGECGSVNFQFLWSVVSSYFNENTHEMATLRQLWHAYVTYHFCVKKCMYMHVTGYKRHVKCDLNNITKKYVIRLFRLLHVCKIWYMHENAHISQFTHSRCCNTCERYCKCIIIWCGFPFNMWSRNVQFAMQTKLSLKCRAVEARLQLITEW